MHCNKKIFILTSGGDAPGMNSAIFWLSKLAEKFQYDLYAVLDGINGLVNLNSNNIIKLDSLKSFEYINNGGTWIGTSRFKDFYIDIYPKSVAEKLEKEKIDCLFVLGGDGSYKASIAISKYTKKFSVIGIPCSIDNDVQGTEFSIGFFSAVESVNNAFQSIKDTGSSHRRIMILEVMGNKSIDLAKFGSQTSGCVGFITSLEKKQINNMAREINKQFSLGARVCLICVPEKTLNIDILAEEIFILTGIETKTDKLGYLQRGCKPISYDRYLSNILIDYAVDLINSDVLLQGVVGIKLGSPLFTSFEDLY